MSHYFGTDGFRGEAGSALTASHAYRIGRFLGHYYKKEGHRPRIALGKDTRRSSYMLEYALAAGLVASGADAYMLHVTTTPSVSFITRQSGMDCGVMISASHNPFSDNGIKLVNRLGEKMEGDVLDAIEDYLDTPDRKDFAIHCATGEDVGRIIDDSEGRNRYVAYLISLAKHSYRGFRIGLDCANGSAWRIAESVFCALGARVLTIGCEPDGLNINREVGSTHIDRLVALVKSNHLDAGFAFDGDADRCLAVDELGNVLTGDHILYALAGEWRQKGLLTGDTVVTTIMSNMGLYRALEEQNIRHVETAVGDKYVYEAMNKGGFSIGGEASGHIILRPYAQTGDGILTAIQLMEWIAGHKLPLSRAAGEVRMFPQKQYNLRVTNKSAVLQSAAVQKAVKQAEEALGDRGRIVLRESGTEPVIRLMVEADDEKLCDMTATALRDFILSQGF